MSALNIDARGCSCPEPVLMVKKALSQTNKIKVKVDSSNAVENITRFAENQKCKVTTEIKDGEYLISITRTAS